MIYSDIESSYCLNLLSQLMNRPCSSNLGMHAWVTEYRKGGFFLINLCIICYGMQCEATTTVGRYLQVWRKDKSVWLTRLGVAKRQSGGGGNNLLLMTDTLKGNSNKNMGNVMHCEVRFMRNVLSFNTLNYTFF